MTSIREAILVFGVDLGTERPKFLGPHEDMGDYLEERFGDRELEKTYIADLDWYGHYDYPRFIASLRGTKKTVDGWGGDTATIDPDDLLIYASRLDAFRAWLLDHDVVGKPKWIMASQYD